MPATMARTGLCARCGAALARDHLGASLCSPCEAAAVREAQDAPTPEQTVMPTSRLACAVLGVLLIYSARWPERRAPLRQELRRLGIEAEAWQIHDAVNEWRRRGVAIDARERRRGYRFVDFALVPITRGFRRRRVRRSQPSLF